MKQSVVFVLPSLQGGGAEKVVVRLINEFLEELDIYLVLLEPVTTTKYKALLKLSENRIISLNKRGKFDVVRLIFSLRKVLKAIKPDIVMSFLMYSNVLSIFANSFTKRKPFLIVNERTYLPGYLERVPFGRVKRFFITKTYAKANLILANSEKSKQALISQFHFIPDKVHCIPNPVAIDSIRAQAKTDPPENIASRDIPFFLFTGRFHPGKRVDLLIEAFSKLMTSEGFNKRISLVLVGEGPERKKIERMVVSLNLQNNVQFVDFQENPYTWMARAYATVLCSDYEGFPNVLLESLACGTPVISTDCLTGPNEIIIPGRNGVLVPVNDASALADAMRHFVTEPEFRNQLASNALTSIQKYEERDVFFLYKELLSTDSMHTLQCIEQKNVVTTHME